MQYKNNISAILLRFACHNRNYCLDWFKTVFTVLTFLFDNLIKHELDFVCTEMYSFIMTIVGLTF